ncbi:MAG TPA: hypothetical protein VGM90_35160 [Kofleriaceae bacterium]|jgi:hypothetical protein
MRCSTFVALCLVGCGSSALAPSTPVTAVPAVPVAKVSTAKTYSLAELPVTEWTGGLPVSGHGTLVVDLAPQQPTDWSTATGRVDFTCDGCRLGDDATKIATGTSKNARTNAFAGDGIWFGHLDFTVAKAHVDFAAGKVHVTVQLRSPDLVLDSSVTGTLAPAAADIAIDGCIAFHPTNELSTRDPKTYAVISTTGASLDESGNYTIQLAGTVGAMKRMALRCAVAAN